MHADRHTSRWVYTMFGTLTTRNDRAQQSQCKRKQKKARLFYVECNLSYEKCFKSDVCPKLNTYIKSRVSR